MRVRQGFADANKLLIELILEGSLLLLVHVFHPILPGETVTPSANSWAFAVQSWILASHPQNRIYPK